MSRDKQIEEMAREICSEYDCIIPCQSCAYYGYANCRDVKSAEKLFAAGYRKSTDLAEEIFAEIEKCSEVALMNGHIETPILCIGFGVLAELKKKYIGKDTNVLTNTEWKFDENCKPTEFKPSGDEKFIDENGEEHGYIEWYKESEDTE